MTTPPFDIAYDRALVEVLARGRAVADARFTPARGPASFAVTVVVERGPLGTTIADTVSASHIPYATAMMATGPGAGAITRDEWVHVFVTYDGSRRAAGLKIFLNGKPAETDVKLDARGPKEAAGIRGSGYGVTLTSAVQDALMIAPVSALVTLLTGALAGQLGATAGAPFVAASVLASLAFLPLSNEVHPYLHMPREEALAKAGPLMRKFLESDYVSFIARTHYVHHHNARVNQNLLPGADFALGYQAPGVDTIVALRKLGTFY